MSDASAAAVGEPLYAIPSGEPVELELAPRKTSWDAGTASSQVALGAYLDHVQELAAPRLAGLTSHLALRLDVGVPANVDPLHEHDLDNFLHPVIGRLGGKRFVTAWATKAPGRHSLLRIESAEPALAEQGWQRWVGRTTVSTARERDWKGQVKKALVGAGELPPGPVAVQISLTVDPTRSWPNLWKMAIDALDPILGRSFPDDEWDPKDGRVVRLGIHVREDPTVGWDVPFVIRARPAALDGPEMAWFAAMSETERAGWLADHQRRCTPNRRSRRGAGPRSAAAHPRSVAATKLPAESPIPSRAAGLSTAASAGADAPILDITTVHDFTAAVAGGQLLVITDSAKPAKLHPIPGDCSGVTEDNFVGKVIERGGRGGRYYTVISESAARERWPRLTICGTCS